MKQSEYDRDEIPDRNDLLLGQTTFVENAAHNEETCMENDSVLGRTSFVKHDEEYFHKTNLSRQ